MNNMGGTISFNGTTIGLKAGESQTLTDSNGILADYPNLNVNEKGVNITHTKGQNTMTFDVSNDCTEETIRISDAMFANWGFTKESTGNTDTTVYISFDGDVQDQIYSLNYYDPSSLAVTLTIEAKGKFELTKIDSTGTLIDGAVFNIKGPDFDRNVTVTNGEIVLDNLNAGIYSIKEVSAPYRILA